MVHYVDKPQSGQDPEAFSPRSKAILTFQGHWKMNEIFSNGDCTTFETQ